MLLRFIAFLLKTMITLTLLGALVAIYFVYYCSKDLPDYSQLKDYYPPSLTRIYSADGKLMEEFAREKRIFIPINSIPQKLIQAFVAAEDKNFYHHEGIDITGITRAAINNIIQLMNHKKAVQGGSTITQQVVKNFLLTPEKSITRKVKEAVLSYRISHVFTKDQILELYLNQIYLGKGAYGVAVAALHYFNKSLEELSISECAVLASLPKAPSQYNPERNIERAFIRKNYVINRMYEDGYLNLEEKDQAIAEKIILAKFDKVQTIDADYYAAKVREEVIEMFGEEYFYSAGLNIFTCLDSKIQKAATSALRYGIGKYDYKRGYRGPITKVNISGWKNSLIKTPPPEGLLDNILAVVLEVSDSSALLGTANHGNHKIFLQDLAWTATNLRSVKDILHTGDVVAASFINNKLSLSQIPEVNGGIMVMEHDTGRVLAAEGGYAFGVSKFDRTTQAKRQPGSLIKPFVYMAALEQGAKPNDIFADAPIEVYQGPGLPLWRPKNYENNFLGPITLRKGLEKSRNTVTVRVSQFAGLRKVADMIQRFGINESPALRYSMVLGALESTLSRMTTAYSEIANGGRKIEPQYIELIKDRKGNVIYKRDYSDCHGCKVNPHNMSSKSAAPLFNAPDGEMIIDSATSYQMISILRGAIKRGTGASAKMLKNVIAGKTGTTNQAKDAWFIGFTPKITVGTYIGYDNPRSLGNRASGATVALPVFINFMEKIYKDQDESDLEFPVPSSIELRSIDYDTGTYSNDVNSILEAFKINNEENQYLRNSSDEAAPTKDIVVDMPENTEEIEASEEIY